MNVLTSSACVLLGAVLAVAALSKVLVGGEMAALADSVRSFPGDPVLTARVVVAAELVAAVLLTIPTTARLGLVAAGILMLAYAAGIAHARRSGVSLTCRCFGTDGGRLGPGETARNLALAGVAVLGVLGTTLAPSAGPVHVVGVTMAALCAVSVVRWNDLRYLFRGVLA